MGIVIKSSATAEDLKLINSYAKSELTADDVYTFRVVCCDNQVDRQMDKFSDKALAQMAKMYVGKTVTIDHDASALNQFGRVFKTSVESTGGISQVVADVYVPIIDSTKAFIEGIEAGINKEVSVSFRVGKMLCDVCGTDYYDCGHWRGERYDDKICTVTIDDVSDVYELSFVAVPAQREAGVIKSYAHQNLDEIEKKKKQKNALISLEVRLRSAQATISEVQNYENE